MNAILEDLTTLPPKRLEKRLEELAREAMPCTRRPCSTAIPVDGLTVGAPRRLSRTGRRPRSRARRRGRSRRLRLVGAGRSCASRRHPYWRLLLRVSFERPVTCVFTVAFDIGGHPSDPLRAALPLLLAADRFVFDFDGRLDPVGRSSGSRLRQPASACSRHSLRLASRSGCTLTRQRLRLTGRCPIVRRR